MCTQITRNWCVLSYFAKEVKTVHTRAHAQHNKCTQFSFNSYPDLKKKSQSARVHTTFNQSRAMRDYESVRKAGLSTTELGPFDCNNCMYTFGVVGRFVSRSTGYIVKPIYVQYAFLLCMHSVLCTSPMCSYVHMYACVNQYSIMYRYYILTILAGVKARGFTQLYLQWEKEQAKERDRAKNVRREREDIERSSNDHGEPFVADCCCWLLLLLLPSMQYLNSSVLAFQFAGCCYCHLHRVYISVPLFCYYFGYMYIYLDSRQWQESALEQTEVTTERVFYIIR